MLPAAVPPRKLARAWPTLLALTLLAIPRSWVGAQGATKAGTTAARADAVTNASVAAMVRAHVPDDVIIGMIRDRGESLVATPAALIELSKAGASAEVIRAVSDAARGSEPAPRRETARESSREAAREPASGARKREAPPSRPVSVAEKGIPTEPGVYMRRGSGEWASMEATVYTQAKTGGFLKQSLTYGLAKAKTKAVVRGAHAVVRTADSLPVFLFVFDRTSNGPGGPGGPAAAWFSGATSPNEFSLVQFDEKESSRELVVASSNVFGSSSGTEDKAIVSFTFTKLAAGVYRVTPDEPLDIGEYGFLSASSWGAYNPGSAGANRLFDFSVVEP